MGTPSFAVPILDELLNSKHTVVAVYTSPDKPKGRGGIRQFSSVKESALGKGIPVFQPATLKSPREQHEFFELAPDFVVVAAYGRLVPVRLLTIPALGFLNVHPSLLPAYRGAAPVVTALLEGEQTTGVSLMLLDEGLDTGPLLAQRQLGINEDDTGESLTKRLFQLGAELIRETLPLWLKGRIDPIPQDTARATYTKKLTRGDGQISWEMSGEEIYRRHQAFAPWPGVYTYWRGRILKLLGVQALRSNSSLECGTVVPVDLADISIGVVTGNGILGITRLQIEGKRALPAQEFVRGYPDFLRSRLPS